jgi:hypothetical protein
MTAEDKKKMQYLVGLLVIAGLTWALIYRTGLVSSAAGTAKKQGTTKPVAAKQFQDPTIHSELVQTADADAEVGQKNIFQYRQKPLPPAPPAPPRPMPVPQAQVYTPPVNTTPPPPPLPVMKTFKYDGLSILGSPKSGKMMASVTDGTTSYQVTVGECLMGQYCVRSITERDIEIEDVQLKQRRTFPKVPSLQ